MAQIDVHRLDVGVIIQSVFSQLTSDCKSQPNLEASIEKINGVRTSALLEPTEGHVGVQYIATVHPSRPSLESVRSIQRTGDILGEDGSSETVEGIVRLVNNILLVLELDHDTDGAEDLLLDDLHIRLGVRKDRRLNGPDGRISSGAAWRRRGCKAYLDEVTHFPKAFAANVDLGALILSRLDVRHNTLETEKWCVTILL